MFLFILNNADIVPVKRLSVQLIIFRTSRLTLGLILVKHYLHFSTRSTFVIKPLVCAVTYYIL